MLAEVLSSAYHNDFVDAVPIFDCRKKNLENI